MEEGGDAGGERREPRVVGQSLLVATENLLDDDSQFETGEDQVKRHMRGIAVCFADVVLNYVGAGEAAGLDGDVGEILF